MVTRLVGLPSSVLSHYFTGSTEPCDVVQGDHLSGKPGKVRECDSCQGNVGDFTENQGKNLVREKLPKAIYCKLHICVHTGI